MLFAIGGKALDAARKIESSLELTGKQRYVIFKSRSAGKIEGILKISKLTQGQLSIEAGLAGLSGVENKLSWVNLTLFTGSDVEPNNNTIDHNLDSICSFFEDNIEKAKAKADEAIAKLLEKLNIEY